MLKITSSTLERTIEYEKEKGCRFGLINIQPDLKKHEYTWGVECLSIKRNIMIGTGHKNTMIKNGYGFYAGQEYPLSAINSRG